MYDKRQDWIQHERTHQTVWRCEDHLAEVFHDVHSYQNHLNSAHGLTSDSPVLQSLSTAAETYTKWQTQDCSICEYAFVEEKTFHSHMALHLEKLALFSLPRSVKNADDSAKSVDSDKAQSALADSRGGDFSSTGLSFNQDERSPFPVTMAPVDVVGRWQRAIEVVIRRNRVTRIARAFTERKIPDAPTLNELEESLSQVNSNLADSIVEGSRDNDLGLESPTLDFAESNFIRRERDHDRSFTPQRPLPATEPTRWTTSVLGWTGENNQMHHYNFRAPTDGTEPFFELRADALSTSNTPKIVYLDDQDS